MVEVNLLLVYKNGMEWKTAASLESRASPEKADGAGTPRLFFFRLNIFAQFSRHRVYRGIYPSYITNLSDKQKKKSTTSENM